MQRADTEFVYKDRNIGLSHEEKNEKFDNVMAEFSHRIDGIV